MHTYISILRGINVSGQKLIRMEALREMYEKLGFKNVRSYVQSGNVLFDHKSTDKGKLAASISSAIKKTFGFDVPVIVLTAPDLKKIIAGNPFAGDKGKDPAFLHITFLAEAPKAYDRSAMDSKKQAGEEIHYADRAIYLYCPRGYGNSKLSNNLVESRLKVTATTRNWKTSNELLRMAEEK